MGVCWVYIGSVGFIFGFNCVSIWSPWRLSSLCWVFIGLTFGLGSFTIVSIGPSLGLRWVYIGSVLLLFGFLLGLCWVSFGSFFGLLGLCCAYIGSIVYFYWVCLCLLVVRCVYVGSALGLLGFHLHCVGLPIGFILGVLGLYRVVVGFMLDLLVAIFGLCWVYLGLYWVYIWCILGPLGLHLVCGVCIGYILICFGLKFDLYYFFLVCWAYCALVGYIFGLGWVYILGRLFISDLQ